MKLPQKRERVRSGIQRAPQREWPRHRKYIRSLECSVPNCGCAMGIGAWEMVEVRRIECCHVRTKTDGGGSLKPSDWWTIPLCGLRHCEQHHTGEAAFEKRHGIDMKKIALALAKQSPDTAMRECMKELGL